MIPSYTAKLKSDFRNFLRREAKQWCAFLLLLFSFRSAIADWNDVPTGSMKPTIMEGDRIFVNKLAYDLKVPFTTWHIAEWGNPSRGEVAVFFSPADGQRLVKRVVGLPGDVIEMKQEILYVNGNRLNYGTLAESYSRELPKAETGSHQFASEVLGAHEHPVMATPSLRAMRDFGPITVKTGEYFMMGDNRDNSYDSRYFGTVKRGNIVGRATSVVISLDRANYYAPRLHRFFTALP